MQRVNSNIHNRGTNKSWPKERVHADLLNPLVKTNRKVNLMNKNQSDVRHLRKGNSIDEIQNSCL